ncbi:MAG: acyl--CoA ligase [Acidimicrobiaceae bacterium]|nr:acyl--CoA ligase [Acidimicrobiaceae bacterium]
MVIMVMSIAEADRQLTAPGQPFEVDEIDIRGIPTRVWKHCPPTLGDILNASRGHGDAIFLVYEDERISFEQHFRASVTLAHVLRDRFGVRNGDRVAIAMRNFPEWSVAFWAAAAAGAIVVPLNAWWSGEELQYGLADSGSTLVFADAERAQRLRDQRAALPDVGTVIVARAGDLALKDGELDFDEVLGESSPYANLPDTPLPDVGLHPDDDATIFYTSGTTGRPKGALGTHRNICTNPMSLIYVNIRNAHRAAADHPDAPPAEASGANAYLLSVPFFHATGCHSILVTNALVGGKLVMMYRWDPGRALELIEREQITTFGGVPAMVMQVLDHPDFETRDTSSVKSVGYGGAPAPPELVKRITAHFPGGSASNGYGMTETSSLSTMNSGPDYIAKPDSVGPPVPVVSVKVVDPDGKTVPQGAVGELWIFGPNIVRGYWNNPEATASTFTDGWVHTGDIARLDEEGFVYIVDRAKDMLIRGGENIYCVEVEAVLYEHPAVADCAVIGVPHPTLGEEPGAVVQLRPGQHATEAELQAHVASRMAAFNVPVRVWFVDEPLPRNPAGKILKRELRDDLVGQPS